MAISYITQTAQQILHKPVQIKDVVKGIIGLAPPHKSVITSETAANCINLIFDDIQTHASPLLAEMTTVKNHVYNYSNYLFKTSDEITLEMHKDLGNTAHVSSIRTELSNVFDKMQIGYTESTDLAMDVSQLVADFYSGNTSVYYLTPNNYFDGTFDANYNVSVMDGIIAKFMAANSRHYEFSTTLADLINKYPNITIEEDSTTPVAKMWDNKEIFIGITPAPGGGVTNPTMRFYTQGNTGTGLPNYEAESYAAWEDTIILSKTHATFDVFFDDKTMSGTTAQWVDTSGITQTSLTHAATSISASQLRGITLNKTLFTQAVGGHNQDPAKIFIRPV